jgi:uncharacterized protein (TIGR03437 family)
MKRLLWGAGLVLSASPAWAQQYLISTYAGGAAPPLPTPGTSAAAGSPFSVATDASGNLYFSSTLSCVFKLDQNSVLTRVAGNCRQGYSGDGGPAASAQLNQPIGIAVDGSGNLYIADAGNNLIRKVSSSGIITTVAGDGSAGLSGDGGPATSAQLDNPEGIAVDAAGNLYIADTVNAKVRKVSPSGIITTLAGTGTQGYSGDGGLATAARLSKTYGVAADGNGNVYIADTLNQAIREVSASGTITTIAGTGTPGALGVGGPATSAELWDPFGIALDGAGNLYIADFENSRICEISNGILTNIAGVGTSGFSGDGGPAIAAQLYVPSGVAVSATGAVLIADQQNSRIRRISPGGTITTVAGNGDTSYSGDGGAAVNAQLSGPVGVLVDSSGDLLFADTDNARIRKVSSGGIITTVAGNGSFGSAGDGGPAASAQLTTPTGIALDGAGNLYIADYSAFRVRKIAPNGTITTVAGNGTRGYSGDGGLATSAELNNPYNVAVDRSGNLYIADTANNRIRMVSPTGTITTVAGTGIAGYFGDGGPAVGAELNNPYDVVVDAAGNLYISDRFNYRIRQVAPGGVITTVAGIGFEGYFGDGGLAVNAELGATNDLAVDGAGNLYIADETNFRIRKVSAAGTITTIAGNGGQGYSGDGGPGIGAPLIEPLGVCVDSAGNIYVADHNENAIRLLTPTNQSVLVSAVVDAASESASPVTPGKIVAIYGVNLGPDTITLNQPANGVFGTHTGGTAVTFNGVDAPIIYSFATQVAVIAPYEISGASTAQVVVTAGGQLSFPFTVQVAASAPSFFSTSGTGSGQIAAVNGDGSLNNAASPVKAGGYISLFATGEGQTSPAGVDGLLAATPPYPAPLLPVTVTVGGLPATVAYAGTAPTEVAGLMQVVVQIPQGVQPGGYVPVVLKVGNNATVNGAAWIAVAAN